MKIFSHVEPAEDMQFFQIPYNIKVTVFTLTSSYGSIKSLGRRAMLKGFVYKYKQTQSGMWWLSSKPHSHNPKSGVSADWCEPETPEPHPTKLAVKEQLLSLRRFIPC